MIYISCFPYGDQKGKKGLSVGFTRTNTFHVKHFYTVCCIFSMIYVLVFSWGPKNVRIGSKITGITVIVGTFNSYKVGFTHTLHYSDPFFILTTPI